MTSRDKIKRMLAIHLKNELVQVYKNNGFVDTEIDLIVQRENRTKSFVHKAEELIYQFEKDTVNEKLEAVAAEIKATNVQYLATITNSIAESSSSKHSVLDELAFFRSIVQSANLNMIVNDLSALQLEQDILKNMEGELNRIAREKASKYSYAFVIASFISIATWGILIKSFKWDYLEPITLIFGLVLVLLSNLTYAIWGSKLTPEDVRLKRFEKYKKNLYDLYKFSPDQLTLLQAKIETNKTNHRIYNSSKEVPHVVNQGLPTHN
jgi:hypothetical protein